MIPGPDGSFPDDLRNAESAAAVPTGPVLDSLRRLSDFTPRERMVARALSANYPVAGLATLATLAKSAGVSRPTVLRFVRTLGFSGYGEFQNALRAEIAPAPILPPTTPPASAAEPDGEPHSSSSGPLSKLSARAIGESSSLPGFARALTARIDEAFSLIPVRDLEESIRLLTDPNARVLAAGGRFSSVLADYLSNNLSLVRSSAQSVNDPFGHSAGRLIDLGPRDTLVLFDFPRYQHDIIELADMAVGLGARVIAVSDSADAPVCRSAAEQLIVPTEGPTPLDSYGAATILVEYLVARVFEQLEQPALERMRRWNNVGRGRMVE